jgi:MoaA/NifB/PqqE/SkfB family radical SAM enzyme
MNLKLDHVLWELTPKCNKNCDYCGSKSIQSADEPSKELVDKITQELIDYKVPSVTLTGGEPTISPYFEEVVTKLHEAGIKVKVVTNGMNLKPMKEVAQYGISVNTLDDIFPPYRPFAMTNEFLREKGTIITNFGLHNIFDFDKIADFVIKSEASVWQIQLTMGKGMLSSSGIAHLRKLINERFPHSNPYSPIIETGTVQIQLADNLQYVHDCMAGIKTCSITFDGDIVACLSERAWGDYFSFEGNLEGQTLKYIWENEFNQKRFDCSKCCRDCIQYPEIEPESKLTDAIRDIMNPYRVPSGSVYVPPKQPATFVYDVAEPYERFTNPIFYGTSTDKQMIWDNRLGGWVEDKTYPDSIIYNTTTGSQDATSSSVDASKIKEQSSFTDDTVENSQDEK